MKNKEFQNRIVVFGKEAVFVVGFALFSSIMFILLVDFFERIEMVRPENMKNWMVFSVFLILYFVYSLLPLLGKNRQLIIMTSSMVSFILVLCWAVKGVVYLIVKIQTEIGFATLGDWIWTGIGIILGVGIAYVVVMAIIFTVMSAITKIKWLIEPFKNNERNDEKEG